MPSNYDDHIKSYFTGSEDLSDNFKESITAPILTKRFFVIYGVGGSGKSSLLHMFQGYCRDAKIPVAIVSADDTKSIIDTLTQWMNSLQKDKIKFTSLQKTLQEYRSIQAKINEQVKKAQDTRERVVDIASKVASKGAEAASGAVIGATIGSIIPGIGTEIGAVVGGILGGTGAEVLIDWLRGFLTKPDIDLLLDPSQKLTVSFLEDIAKTAEKHRIVLMIDTFEQISTLENWACDLFQNIHSNVLIVIAGREIPDWNRAWPSWMAKAQVNELKAMKAEDMRLLIHRYYAVLRGGEPNPDQVNSIVNFAHGLPIVGASAVQLWVKYGVEDFHAVKAEIMANLVDRLMEGVPTSLIPVLETAAIVRWFDQSILRSILELEDVRHVYNELRKFPFVRTRLEGLAIHHSMREIMDENLLIQDPEHHFELHNRAALYFEKQLQHLSGKNIERFRLEHLYHSIRANEEKGIILFQELAEEWYRYRFANRLRLLLNDVNQYKLNQENSNLWREYYNTKLAKFEHTMKIEERDPIYTNLATNQAAMPKLKAFALSDLASNLTKSKFLKETGGVDKAFQAISACQELLSYLTDERRDILFKNLQQIYKFQGEREKGLKLIEEQVDYYNKKNDLRGVINNLQRLRYAHAQIGNWQQAFVIRQKLDDLLQKTEFSSKLIDHITVRDSKIELIATGQYFNAEKAFRHALKICQDENILWNEIEPLRGLALVLGLQHKYNEAESLFDKIIAENIAKNPDWVGNISFSHRGRILAQKGDLVRAEEFLLKALSEEEKESSHMLPITHNRLGMFYEIKFQVSKNMNDLIASETYYQKAMDYQRMGRLYHYCFSIIGLIRVKHIQGDYTTVTSLIADAEQLAQEYEYNDLLSALYLTQSHIFWETGKRNKILAFYKKALIHALRYNRFLLDEILSGDKHMTPHSPIIPYCLNKENDGRKLLISLRNWWKNGLNKVGTARPDTISPIPENISLIEAEKIARNYEPGDGSIQKTVIEQIESVLL